MRSLATPSRMYGHMHEWWWPMLVRRVGVSGLRTSSLYRVRLRNTAIAAVLSFPHIVTLLDSGGQPSGLSKGLTATFKSTALTAGMSFEGQFASHRGTFKKGHMADVASISKASPSWLQALTDLDRQVRTKLSLPIDGP